MKEQTISVSNERLASLDILRGFDLFLLVFLQPILMEFGRLLNFPWLNTFLYQFDHEVWEGFRLWDLVMPLFLFMTGASMPFSFAKYKHQSRKFPIYYKITKRFILLFILGMIVQGNLLGMNPQHLFFYSNTLQAIASGYLIASIFLLHGTLNTQLWGSILLLIIYWIPMTFCGDFTPEGNFAEKIDRWILGRFRDGVFWDENGNWHFSAHYTYTWIWSTLNFGATVMSGCFAGQLIQKGKNQPLLTVKQLSGIGILLIIIGLIWSIQMPIIKRLWTSSMVLFSSGLCYLLMAIFYFWIDYKKRIFGWEWLKIYGMNSIAAYMMGEAINFRCIGASLSYGLEPYLGEYYPTWLNVLNYVIIFLILRHMYRYKIFLKI